MSGACPAGGASASSTSTSATSSASMGWNRTLDGNGMRGSFDIALTMSRMKPLWNWVARKFVHGSSDPAMISERENATFRVPRYRPGRVLGLLHGTRVWPGWSRGYRRRRQPDHAQVPGGRAGYARTGEPAGGWTGGHRQRVQPPRRPGQQPWCHHRGAIADGAESWS